MTKTLYTLAYPSISDEDRERIELFRQQHDLPFKDVVAAHFTLVFGYSALPLDEYIEHVSAVASNYQPINFACRYAMLGNDHAEDCGYVFLVPDEGNSDVSRLHDNLYSGKLESALKLDIPFIPHITVGTLPTTEEAKALCDEWNTKPFSIEGKIEQITIVELDNGKVTDLQNIPLNFTAH